MMGAATPQSASETSWRIVVTVHGCFEIRAYRRVGHQPRLQLHKARLRLERLARIRRSEWPRRRTPDPADEAWLRQELEGLGWEKR